jgi:hypothetical protein
VKAGDPVLHLRDDTRHNGFFVGYSLAEQDGYETSERPPSPGEWGYSPAFYRASLTGYTPFPQPLSMKVLFDTYDTQLRDYIERNSKLPDVQRRTLFCVIQGGELQRQNGGYLTEVDEELENLLLGTIAQQPTAEVGQPDTNVTTGVVVRALQARVGQREFSERVRANYGDRCCFPDCDISDDNFLAGSHIARWADIPELRGRGGWITDCACA